MDSPPKVQKAELASNYQAEQIEAAKAPTPTTRKARYLAHLKRFWWAYAIGGALLILLFVMLLLYVAVPAIAQGKIDKVVLAVQGISCTDTKTNSFTMGLNTTLKSGTTKATVESFTGVMYLEDVEEHTPFVSIVFPNVKNQPFQALNISQSVAVTDTAALTQFNSWLLNNETLRVTVLGKPKLKISGIAKKYTVTFKKTITMPGLNGFAGISTSDNSLTITNYSDGTNFHTTASIPNRSLVTFDIGNVTFNTFFNDSSVGTSYLDNVILRPGDNSFPLRALIAQVPIITAVTTEPYCANNTLPMSLSGTSVTNYGEDLPYMADALATHNTTVDVDLRSALLAISINATCSS